MKRVLLLVTVALALAPATAQAVTLVNPDGTVAEPYQTWANQSKVPTVGSVITIVHEGTACATSCALRDGSTIKLVDIGAMPMQVALLHELGHMFDFQMPEWKRTVFTKIYPFSVPTPWISPAGVEGHSVPTYEEFWADNYARCALGMKVFLWDNAYARPTRGANARTCKLIRL